MDSKEVIVFIIQLLTTLTPSLLLLWRFEVSEKKKSLADTAGVFQTIANNCAENLEAAMLRIDFLEDYNRQLQRTIELMGGNPPAPRRPQK